MKLTRLAESCKKGTCPTVYATDRGTIAVQGYLVDGMELARGEAVVEIPLDLLKEAARVCG